MSELFPSWLVWSLLLKKARTRCYPAGQPLVSTELQLFSSLIYLINGTVAIESIASTQSPGVALAFVNSPGVVGEMSFGSSSKPNAVVKAHTDIDCLVVDAQDVFRRLNKRPHLKPYVKHLLLLLRVRRSPPSLVSRQLELLGVAEPPDSEGLRSLSDDVSALWRRNSPAALLDSSLSSPPAHSSSSNADSSPASSSNTDSSSLSSSPASEKKDTKRLSSHWSARTMLASIRNTASPAPTTTAITTLTLSGSGNDSVGFGATSGDEPSTVRRKGSMRMRSSASSSAIEAPSVTAAALQAGQPLFRYAILHKLLDSKLLQNPRLWSDVEAIFFTHRYVFHQDVNERTSSDQLLLDFLVESYNNSVKANRQELPLIIEAMTRWLRLGIEHANRPTSDQAAALHRQFDQFVEQVERQRSELNVDAALSGLKEALADSRRRLEQLYEQQSAAPLSPTAHRLSAVSLSQPSSLLSTLPSVDVDDFEAGELAALLTSIEWELLRALPVGELLSMRFAKPETSLKLRELVGHFNRVTNIVTTSILLRPTTLLRAQLMGGWIAVAEEAFRSYCNYSLVFQILSALSGTSISRLRQAWAGVSKPALRTFQELQRIVNPLDNYAEYRRLLADQSKPMLPVLPVFQKDLTFLEEAIAEQFRTNCGARPSLIDESALVPWSQIRQVGAIAKCVFDCQQSWGYPPPKHQAVFAQLYAGYPSLSEEQCYAVSTAVEPLRAATLAAVNFGLTADIDADKLLPELPRVVCYRVHVPREHNAAAKRLGLRGPVLAKTLMIGPNESIKDVRPRLVDKLFWRCSGGDDVASMRQDMAAAWGLFTGETLLPDEGPWPQNAQFCDVVFKPLLVAGKSKGAKGDGSSSATTVQQIAQLFAQVDDLRSSFQREMTTIHGEIEQMKKTIDALAGLLQDRIQGEAEMSSFDNEWSD